MFPGAWRPHFYFLNTWWLYFNAWLQNWHRAHESFSAANSHPPSLITSPSAGLYCCSLHSHCAGLTLSSSYIQCLLGPTLRILVRLSFLQVEATLLPSFVVVLKARLLLHKAFVTELFCQAWWSGLTVVILTSAFLFGHMHVYFLLSLHIDPTIIYLNCFLICLLAKKFLQHSIIAMTIIIILSH